MLTRLASDASSSLMRSAIPVELTGGMRLSEPGQKIEYVYFPVAGLIATDATTHTGESVLISLIGREGLAGWCGLLDHPQMLHAVTVQSPGRAFRVRISTAREEFERGGLFTKLVHAFMYLQVAQMSQSVLCNRLHCMDQRLARWLLTMSDQMESECVQVTHEGLAQMLGSRRSTVTVAATRLQEVGILGYRRGKVQIVSRPRLEECTCECYGMVNRIYAATLEKMG